MWRSSGAGTGWRPGGGRGGGAGGFVLPVTLLVTSLLTVMLTAAFLLASVEYRTSDNSLSAAGAFGVAQAGLNQYLSTVTTEPNDGDSTRLTLTGGYADVIVRRVRTGSPKRPPLWIVISKGTVTSPTQPGQPAGRRTVAQFATWNPGRIPVRAALLAANGIWKDTGTGELDGLDKCGPSSNDVHGVTVPPVGYVQTSGPSVPNGANPKIEQLTSATAVMDSTYINWPALLAGDFVPDYTIPPQSWPTAAWGAGTYTVIKVVGDAVIPDSGRGLLVVTGNASFPSNALWRGVIIVGGRVSTTATQAEVRGALITGLNISQGADVPADSIQAGGNKKFVYYSCEVASATNALSTLVPLRNAWVDTWATY